MGFRKIAIVFLTVLLVLMGLLCGRVSEQLYPETEETQESLPFVFLVDTGESVREIVPWRDGQGKYTVFLPSHAQLQQVRISCLGEESVLLGDQPMENGMSCGEISLEQTYAVQWGQQTGEIVFLRSAEMPSVYVDTRSGDMAYIHSLKGSEEPGKMQIMLPDGSTSFSGSLRTFGGRGNATWELEKKPYKLELDQEADILGMGAAKKWVLLANTFDPSHIRNKTVLDAAAQVGLAYSPESTWVDLYLNGEYAGLYLLCEKNEIHPNRVDIEPSAGVLISIEKEDRLWEYGGSQFLTDGGIPIRVRQNPEEMIRVQEKLASLENAIAAPDGLDPVTGRHWSDMIDLDSWAKKYLIEEVFGNLDAGSISQFFYWEGDGKIFAGPVWDYDICMGNQNNWQIDTPQMLYSGRPHLWDPEDTPLYYSLYQKPEFRKRVEELYTQQFRPVLQALLEEGMETDCSQIRQATRLNSIRWGTGSSDEAYLQMRDYMTQRMAFLDSLWLDGEYYHLVSVYVNWHVMACYAVPDGGRLEERIVPGGTDTIIYEGWYDWDTGLPFDFSAPIMGDRTIYLKETNLLSAGEENNGFSLRKAVTYVPAAALAMLLLAVLTVDRKTRRREKEGVNDKFKVSP